MPGTKAESLSVHLCTGPAWDDMPMTRKSLHGAARGLYARFLWWLHAMLWVGVLPWPAKRQGLPRPDTFVPPNVPTAAESSGARNQKFGRPPVKVRVAEHKSSGRRTLEFGGPKPKVRVAETESSGSRNRRRLV